MSEVAVVVVNHDGAEQLAACLASFRRQRPPPAALVVVDNASSDGSRELLAAERAHDPRLRVIHNATNRGYAGGANDGLAATRAPVVAVANFDVRPAPGFLAAAARVLETDPACGAVQGKLLRTRPGPAGGDVIDTTGHLAFRTRLFRNRGEGELDRGQYDRPGEVFGVSGALAVYRRSMLEELAVPTGEGTEVFDEDLFAYFEDVDLDWRAHLGGWRIRYEPEAEARHERGGAGPRRTALVERLNWRNRLLCVLKNDHAPSLAAALPGVAGTTLLKALELGVTAPTALLGGLVDLRLASRMLAKRRVIGGRAVVSRRAVVQRWFGPFDYAAWVATWWRRVRAVPPGA